MRMYCVVVFFNEEIYYNNMTFSVPRNYNKQVFLEVDLII